MSGAVQSVQFTPFAGLLGIAERVARVLEARTGVPLWDGSDGLSAFAAAGLRELGVPETSIAITPRLVADTIVRRTSKRRARK